MDLNELRNKRGVAVAQARAILEKATKEKRAMSTEERTNYDKAFADAAALKDTIASAEQLEVAERELSESQREPNRPDASTGRGHEHQGREGRARILTEKVLPAFRSFLRFGMGGVKPEERAVLEAECRALQADSGTAGGYLVPPLEWAQGLIKAVDDMVFVRKLATVTPVSSADGLGLASLDADPADSEWTTEIETGGEDSTMAFGKRELKPHPLAKRIKVSNKLLRQRPDVENLVRDRLAYKVALPQEKKFLTGNGAGQPLGIFTASADGIPTSRDVSTGNTTTAITGDNLRSVKYSLKAPYRAKAQWIAHRDWVLAVSKLKDGNGQYLWQPGLVAGEPDRVLNLPFNESEHAPATFTTGLYVAALGDFSYYHIVDALSFQLQRLVELYAATNQTGFIVRAEVDGMPVLGEAFARQKLA